MRVILSCGQGPLHFVSAAHAIAGKVEQLNFICGYVPRKEDSLIFRLLAWMKGKDVRAAIKKRKITGKSFEVSSCGFSEAVQQIVEVLCRFFPRVFDFPRLERIPWLVFGWQSKEFIKNAEIFHVRSGAGHGGAIARAKKQGMKVIVDHSIAHPKFMDENMCDEFERNGIRFTMGMRSSFWKMIDEECRMADLVQVNSGFVKETFVDAGYAPERIRVVRLGVRSDFFGLRNHQCTKGPLKLLFTGGFGFRKGAEYLLEALKILKTRGVEVLLDVVGDFRSAESLIAKYSDCSLPIVFHGQMPQDELKSFLSAGDIYVFPSLAEGCAQSGMEAMAAGMCVVGTYESGFPIVDGETGYIVPMKDAKSIADRVEWLSMNRKEIDRVGAAAAKLVRENYTWEKFAENTITVYRDLLNG